MGSERIDSEGWTGDMESQTAPGHRFGRYSPSPPTLNPMPSLRPPGWWRDWKAFESAPQRRARRHAAFAIIAPFTVAAASALLKASIRDLWITAPDPWMPIILASLFGCGLYACAEFNILPRLVRWIAITAWLASLAAAIGCFVLGAAAHRSASQRPVLRAVLGTTVRDGKSFVYIFRLQDGTIAATYDRLAYPEDCLAVRRLTGRYGFAWLRVVETSPRPGAGQLNWPIDRRACLAGAPMASLRR